MKRFLFLLSAAAVLLFGECKNDIDLIGEYKHVLVCYGLLNPYDTVQYVRVSKGFLGNDNALVMAQNYDTIGFPIGSIEVKIEQWNNSQLIQTFVLSPDTSIPREDGIFLAPYQVLYRGTFPVLKDGSTYKILVTDLVKGVTVTSETHIPQNPTIVEPGGSAMPLNLEDSTYIRFRFKTGQYAQRYDFVVRFHYLEQFLADTTQVSEKYVDWHMGETSAISSAGDEFLQYSVQRYSFLNMLHALIPYNQQVRRISGKMELIFTGAARDLVTYIEVTNANNNTSADIPPFSNIEGGYGLFSARTTTVSSGWSIDQDTQYALRVNPITVDLNFIR